MNCFLGIAGGACSGSIATAESDGLFISSSVASNGAGENPEELVLLVS